LFLVPFFKLVTAPLCIQTFFFSMLAFGSFEFPLHSRPKKASCSNDLQDDQLLPSPHLSWREWHVSLVVKWSHPNVCLRISRLSICTTFALRFWKERTFHFFSASFFLPASELVPWSVSPFSLRFLHPPNFPVIVGDLGLSRLIRLVVVDLFSSDLPPPRFFQPLGL